MSQSQKTLWITVLVTSLSFLGMAFPYPIMAPLFFSEPLYFPAQNLFLPPAILYGLTLAAYPFAQFFGSMWLGKISDKIGRKPILKFSILVTSLGFLLSAKTLYDHNLVLFIFSRFLTGFFEGHVAIARAIAIDLGDEIDKSKSFGWLNAAATSGFLIGPLIGGTLADESLSTLFNPSLPFVVAAVLGVLSLIIVSIYIQEPKKNKGSTQSKTTDSNYSLLKNVNIRYLIIASFFVTLSFDVLYQFFPVFLVERWQFNEFDIAMVTTVLSMFMILSQTILISKVKRFNRQYIILCGAIIYSFMLVLTTIPKMPISLYLTFPILGMCIGLLGTLVPVHVSDQAPNEYQGALMGILMGSRSLGDAGICILGSIAVNYSYLLPFFLGAITMLIGACALLFDFKQSQKVLN
ncbi:MAG: MFS transporter [Francisellaceae bacterium]|jgi:MFS family permease|nr:MFS transporter [Francisellaceae bacterium]MBT6538762.1 MFS transporter [Francisellaceae bacterium]